MKLPMDEAVKEDAIAPHWTLQEFIDGQWQTLIQDEHQTVIVHLHKCYERTGRFRLLDTNGDEKLSTTVGVFSLGK